MSCCVCGTEVPTSADLYPVVCDGCDVAEYIDAQREIIRALRADIESLRGDG